MSYRWMPLFGEFEVRDDAVVFRGKETPGSDAADGTLQQETRPAIGLILSNQTLSAGTLSAEITFERTDHQAVCEVVLGYDLDSKGQISAGLGGSFAMFSIREWQPPSGPGLQQGTWKNYALSGDLVNLQAGRPYQVEVRVAGSRVALWVDEVQVASATVNRALSHPRQSGLFCIGGADITIHNFKVEAQRPRAFVVMQFSSPYNEVYSSVIRRVCSEMDLEPVRADELYGPGIIIKDVIDQLARAQIVIAEISPANPNVYFEVGYALALQKPIILLARREQPDARLPFDISAFRVLFYEDSIAGKERIEEGLRNHIREILGES